LQKILQEEDLIKVPLLIYVNKVDLPNAISAGEIINMFGLNQVLDREWYVQTCCASTGDGLFEGIEWITKLKSLKKK